MKKLLLILLALPLIVIAQNNDWHPLSANQISYFKHGGRLFPMKIDSIISTNEGDEYFNIRTTEVFYEDDDEGIRYHDPMASWLGNSTIIKDDIAIFKNKHDEALIIPYTRNDDSKWRFYDFQDGKYIQAWFSGKENYEIVEGLFDSVKHINFQIYNMDGTEFDSPFNDISLMLSKNYGFVNTYAWYYFPEKINTYPLVYKCNLSGIEKGEFKYGFEWDYDQIVSNYEVGDIIHVGWGDISYARYDYIDEYVNKIVSSDYVEYKIKRTYRNYSSVDIYTKRFDFNKLPRQSLWNDDNEFVGVKQYNQHMWQGKRGYELREYANYYKDDYQGVTYFCTDPYSSMSPYPVTIVNEIHTYDQHSSPDGGYIKIVYYKNKEEEWGEPFPPYSVADYQILRPDIQAFYTAEKGIRIDEIEDLGYGKKMYKSYRNMEPYYYSDGEYYNDPMGSWIGMQTMVYPSGRTVFYNRDYDTIVFEPSFNVGESWIVREFNDGSYTQATIISEEEQMVLPNLMDSVKTIDIQFLAKNGYSDATQDKIIRLSKHYGLIDFPYIYGYTENNFELFELIGLEKNEQVYSSEYSYGDIFTSLEVGDVFHYRNNDFPRIEVKKELLTKKLYNKKVEYTFDVCKRFSGNNPENTTYIEYSTTTIDFPYNLMPSEILMDTTVFGWEVLSSLAPNSMSILCDEQNYYRFNIYKKRSEFTYNGRKFWRLSLFNGFDPYDKNIFIEGVGYYRYRQGDTDRDYDVATYFSNSLMTCGTPYEFSCNTGIEESAKVGFKVFPNPSNGVFTISNNTSKKVDKLLILNISGQVVLEQEYQDNELSINLSYLPAGLYLIKTYLNDKLVINKKIMIQK